jgi:hypothetical protein
VNIVEGRVWGKISHTTQEVSLNLSEHTSLQMRREGKNIWISYFKNETIVGEYRYITKLEDNIFLTPILPDYPLVIKPQIPLSILPGMVMHPYIEVPLFLNVGVGKQEMEYCLVEFPLHRLSKSFFGNPENGEISYFLESPLHEEIDLCRDEEDVAYSPITIKNRSNQVLNFERMILRVPNLNLYSNSQSVFTSPVEIEFRGQEQISLMKIRQSPPKIDNLNLVSKPRKPIDKSILKRSFYFMKSIYSG